LGDENLLKESTEFRSGSKKEKGKKNWLFIKILKEVYTKAWESENSSKVEKTPQMAGGVRESSESIYLARKRGGVKNYGKGGNHFEEGW